MVLKKSKFGGNTGNTLRRNGKGQPPLFCRKAGSISKDILTNTHPIPKEDFNGDWTTCGIPDKKNDRSLNCSEGVDYSLNKDERWLMPEFLKMEIEVERHVARRFTKAAKDKRTGVKDSPKRTDISVSDSVYFGSRHIKHPELMTSYVTPKSRRKEHPTRNMLQEATISYTVKTPVCSKVWPYHNQGKRKRKEKRKKPKLDAYDIDVTDLDHWQDDSIDEYHKNTTHHRDSSCTKFCLELFITKRGHQNKSNTVSTKKLVDNSQRYEKGNNIVIKAAEDVLCANNTFGLGVDPESSSVLSTEVSKPITVNRKGRNVYYKKNCKIEKTQLRPSFLQNMIGLSYTEGACTPRRIAVFKIDLKIINISEDFVAYLEQVFNGNVLDFDSLTDICYPNKNVLKISDDKSDFSYYKFNVERLFKPIAKTVQLANIWQDLCKYQASDNDLGRKQLNFKGKDSQGLCSICYDRRKLITMNMCQHNACETCWIKHVNTRISSGFGPIISCTDTECKQVLDSITVFTFLEDSHIRKFTEKTCEISVQRSQVMKFCTSPDCNTTAISNPPKELSQLYGETVINNPTVLCSCAKRWCFSCAEYEHWPSPCAVNKLYQKKRAKMWESVLNKDGNVMEIEVRYKPCPTCSRPIEKDGGCNHVRCFCGTNFDYDRFKMVHTKLSGLNIFEYNGKRGMRKAMMFRSLLAKLRGSKTRWIDGYIKYRQNDNESSLIRNINNVQIIEKAGTALYSGYRLLENLCVSQSACSSSYTKGEIIRFVHSLESELTTLQKAMNKQREDFIDIPNIAKLLRHINKILNRLESFGLPRL